MKSPLIFFYRATRNALSALPWGRSFLFPQQVLAARFGPDDLMYGIGVFERHLSRLKKAGVSSATDMLEIGPGRNLATGILMLCEFQERATSKDVRLTYWDVFPNVDVSTEFIREVASSLVSGVVANRLRASLFDGWKTLGRVASGSFLPQVHYVVAPMEKFFKGRNPPLSFDLVYSQAAIEHIWKIRRFWQLIMESTCPGGWHSHRIDLADHGKRHTNYIEMLEWSDFAYWITQRFIPGATNRFRASDHLEAVRKGGGHVLDIERSVNVSLPTEKTALARRFRSCDDDELRCVAVDFVARKQE